MPGLPPTCVSTKLLTRRVKTQLAIFARKHLQENNSARTSRVLLGNTCEGDKGYCSAMIQEVLRIDFEELQLHRISQGVYTINTGAIRCFERCGFVKERIFRDVLKFDEYWSLVEMSILKDEWRQIYL